VSFGHELTENDFLDLPETDRLEESARQRLREFGPTRTWPEPEELAVFRFLDEVSEWIAAEHASCLLLFDGSGDLGAVRVSSRMVLGAVRGFWKRDREPLCLLTADLRDGLYLDHTPSDQAPGEDEFELWTWGAFAEAEDQTLRYRF
jgi:hypothetical protein